MNVITKVVVLVENDNKILLIKEWSNKKNGYFWNLIKGTFGDHQGETLKDCGQRESLEEAGIDVAIDDLISCYVSTGVELRIQFNFLAHQKGNKLPMITDKNIQRLREEDIVEIKWFGREELLMITSKMFINDQIYKTIEDWKNSKVCSFEVIS